VNRSKRFIVLVRRSKRHHLQLFEASVFFLLLLDVATLGLSRSAAALAFAHRARAAAAIFARAAELILRLAFFGGFIFGSGMDAGMGIWFFASTDS
jgi:hypothetical protein